VGNLEEEFPVLLSFKTTLRQRERIELAHLARGVSRSELIREAIERDLASPPEGTQGTVVSTLDWLKARVAECVRAETDKMLARLLRAVYAFAEYCMDDSNARAELIRGFEGFVTEALDAK
jgi:hypothetical protein